MIVSTTDCLVTMQRIRSLVQTSHDFSFVDEHTNKMSLLKIFKCLFSINIIDMFSAQSSQHN